MTSNQQRSVLWWLLLATILLCIWLAIQPEDDDAALDLVAPAIVQNKQVRPSSQPIANDSIITAHRINREHWEVLNRDATKYNYPDLFPVQSWAVVASPVNAKPAPLPPPTAPDVPFVYMGKLEDGPNGSQVFLMLNNKVYSISNGEQIDAVWRLDREDSQRLFFTYLPLNLPQILSKSTKVNSVNLPDASAQN